MRHASGHIAVWQMMIMALVACGVLLGTAQAQLGAIVPNTANITYTYGGTSVTVVTNNASFQIEARRTASTIEFLRYFPAGSGDSVVFNGSDYSPSGSMAGPFSSLGPATAPGGTVLSSGNAVPVVAADNYLPGELIIIRVTDPGQNGDPNQIEMLVAEVTASPGGGSGQSAPGPGGSQDRIVIRLYETGPDTGVFVAYFASSSDPITINDAVLNIDSGSRLTATYVDSFDSTEVSVDVAAVNPRGVLFDSLTGTLINGATVTLIDAATGQPAQVYAVDGVSTYPSTIITGQPVTDSSGRTINLGSGEFFFPMVLPGNYYIEVTPPAGYVFSSTLSPGVLAQLPMSPNIVPASFGATFALPNVASPSFDVPLDPSATIVLTKEASTGSGAIGDFITYTIRVENRDSVPAPVNVRDTLPRGFRYRQGSGHLQDGTKVTPTISVDGQTLLFSLSPLAPGEAITLTYLLEIAAGTPMGQAINEAVVVDGDGDAISGIARAEVQVRDDLLRTRATLIGRVSEQACDGNQEWARDIEDGLGVQGVRIYLETGEYAVSDKNGLFHFQGVRPGTHVVQLDEETLPTGFEPMLCEENTRMAGSMTSQFVDVQGGSLWRANFYLKRNADYVEPEAAPEQAEPVAEYLSFDQLWLDGQNNKTAWVYPDTSKTPNGQSVNIGIKHDVSLNVKLTLNGMAVPPTNFQSRDKDSLNLVALSRWKGIDLADGENKFVARLVDADGNTVETIEKNIFFVKTVARAIPLPDQSTLVADGRSVPVMAVRFEDGAGRPVHTGRIVKVTVEEPYYARNARIREGDDPLTSSLSSQGAVAVGEDGIAKIAFEPTLKTGRVRVTVFLDNGRTQQLTMYMKPEKRDWILVSLAERVWGSAENKPNMVPIGGDTWDEYSDGRVAFFAKGMVKGDWLLTLAYDSERGRGVADDRAFNDIDPNAYYTLYGDRSDPAYEAQSRYPFYIKMERETFQAMFGDYDTGLTDSKLSKYNRRLSGFKSVYSGERIDVITFAAEDNQKFGREELAADGTSGPYRIVGAPIVRHSESLRVETRDRFRPDVVIASYPLNRFSDYEIDFLTGQILLRLPLDATDINFNPNVLVVEYETAQPTERSMTYGLRSKLRLTQKADLGVTAIHEQDPGGAGRGNVDLVGADLVVNLNRSTEARVEYAQTTRENAYSAPGETAPRSGSAALVEIAHQSARGSALLSYQRQHQGFGLGQTSTAVENAERLSFETRLKLRDVEDAKTGKRKKLRLETTLWRERNLTTRAQRSAGEIKLNHETNQTSLGVGLRWVEDRLPGNDDQQSVLALASIRHSVPSLGATFTVAKETPVAGQAESNQFPERTILGVDKQLGSRVTLNLRHEILRSDKVKGENSTLGLTVQPWKGANATVSLDRVTQDSAYRLGATVGLDQTVRLTKKWTLSAGAARHQLLDQAGSFDTLIGDDPISPFELNEDYASYYGGLGYRTKKMSLSSRLEYRDAESEDRHTVIFSAARELSESLSLAGITRAQYTEYADRTDETKVDARIGLAYRPRGQGPVILYRFDYKFDKDVAGVETAKLVSNLLANFELNKRTEWSVHYGLKYAEVTDGPDTYDGFTHLLGTEARYDLTPRLDIGFHASGLWSETGKTVDYAYGPSVGFTPMDNIWVSAGYNISGLEDEDFAAAEYRSHGPYIQLRLKLDQNSARGLLSSLSPRG